MVMMLGGSMARNGVELVPGLQRFPTSWWWPMDQWEITHLVWWFSQMSIDFAAIQLYKPQVWMVKSTLNRHELRWSQHFTSPFSQQKQLFWMTPKLPPGNPRPQTPQLRRQRPLHWTGMGPMGSSTRIGGFTIQQIQWSFMGISFW